MKTLPADQQWATDPHEAAQATLDQVHKLLLTTVAHHYQLEYELDEVDDEGTYKLIEKEWFRLRHVQTVLMSLLKSPVG